MQLIFEKSRKGRAGASLPELDVPEKEDFIDKGLIRKELELPEVDEITVVRHYTELSRRNFGVDNGFYPLGSCTMKYNPKVNEDISRLTGFTQLHPYSPFNQGALQLLYEMQEDLKEITGLDGISLQPAAG